MQLHNKAGLPNPTVGDAWRAAYGSQPDSTKLDLHLRLRSVWDAIPGVPLSRTPRLIEATPTSRKGDPLTNFDLASTSGRPALSRAPRSQGQSGNLHIARLLLSTPADRPRLAGYGCAASRSKEACGAAAITCLHAAGPAGGGQQWHAARAARLRCHAQPADSEARVCEGTRIRRAPRSLTRAGCLPLPRNPSRPNGSVDNEDGRLEGSKINLRHRFMFRKNQGTPNQNLDCCGLYGTSHNNRDFGKVFLVFTEYETMS